MGYVPNPPPHVGWASTGIHIQSFLDVANDDTPLHAEALVHFGVGSAAGPSRAVQDLRRMKSCWWPLGCGRRYELAAACAIKV